MKESIDPHREDITAVAKNQQIKRYRYAAEIISPADIVVDAACGVGYGSHILSKKAKRVISIDLSDRFLWYAQEHYRSKNIEYVQADLEQGIPISSDSVECVVSLGTVERLKDWQNFFKSISNVLKSNGTLVVSLPHPENNPHWHHQYHICELKLEDILKILNRDFRDIDVMGQGIFLGMVLRHLYQGGFKPGITENHRGIKSVIDHVPLLPNFGAYISPHFIGTSQYVYIVARK